MSHFHCLLIGNKDQKKFTKSEIESRLLPFSSLTQVAEYYEPVEKEDAEDIRQESSIDKQDLDGLAQKMSEVTGEKVVVVDKKLQYVKTENPDGQYDYYKIGGVWDGVVNKDPKYKKPSAIVELFLGDKFFIERNSCLIGDLPTELEPFAFVLPDGQYISEMIVDEQFDPYGNTTSKKWLKEVEKIKTKYKDNICVLVDMHV